MGNIRRHTLHALRLRERHSLPLNPKVPPQARRTTYFQHPAQTSAKRVHRAGESEEWPDYRAVYDVRPE